MAQELEYYLGFSHCVGIGPFKFSVLMNHYLSAQEAYTAPLRELQELIGPKTANKFDDFRKKFNPQDKIAELTQKNIHIVSQKDMLFPTPLTVIPDPPICIYIKGDITNFDFEKDLCIGVVGTRKPSAYGQQISRIFTADLTQSGCVIVSGMAMGIDTCAHQECLDNGGRTIAVLGCGVDIVYPSSNKRLYEEIIKSGGAVMSEFPPGMEVLPGLFVARNRLISGLSAGIIVIEGLRRSGSLITAKYALEQGKDVFAPPVPLTSQLSEAPTLLLKQGAKLVTTAEDILEEYGKKMVSDKQQNILEGLTPSQKTIVELLIREPQMLDDLIATVQRPLHEISIILSTLEINGVVEKNLEGRYQLKAI